MYSVSVCERSAVFFADSKYSADHGPLFSSNICCFLVYDVILT